MISYEYYYLPFANTSGLPGLCRRLGWKTGGIGEGKIIVFVRNHLANLVTLSFYIKPLRLNHQNITHNVCIKQMQSTAYHKLPRLLVPVYQSSPSRNDGKALEDRRYWRREDNSIRKKSSRKSSDIIILYKTITYVSSKCSPLRTTSCRDFSCRSTNHPLPERRRSDVPTTTRCDQGY
jgi:hypothetical protein